jgi:hypothetical protein
VRETAHPKILRALAEVLDTGLEARVDELVRVARVQRMDDSRLRQLVVELVPDFIVNPEVSPANVVPIERGRTSQLRT